MASVPLTIPDAIKDDLEAAVVAHYGADTVDPKTGKTVDALTSKQLVAYHNRVTLEPIYRADQRRSAQAVIDAIATMETNNATRAAAQQADVDAKTAAEDAADAAASTGVQGIS